MNHYGIEDCPGPLFAAPAQQHSVTSRAAADSLGPATLGALSVSCSSGSLNTGLQPTRRSSPALG